MQTITSKKLAEILNFTGSLIEASFDDVATDSRIAHKGDLFIALKGERFDAHDFVSQVLENGVEMVVVDHLLDNIPAERQLVVEDTLAAFGKIGAYNRSLFKGKVIGLTGSSGKTTTKEEIRFLLSRFASTYATSGNHNNFVGVPRSLCDIDMSAEYAVIEMGMSSKGEIERLTSYVQPDIAVVTNVYPMHIEFFPSFEAIAEAKAEIFSGVKSGGQALINADTNFADVLYRYAEKSGAEIYKFGRNQIVSGDNGCYFANILGKAVRFSLAVDAEHYLYNALCALNVAALCGIDVEEAAHHIKDFGALPGRGKISEILFENKKVTLIDDSYSGQPEAMKLALKAMGKMAKSGRKIAVLGKMAELGETSKQQHVDVGNVAARTDVDIVIGVCPETKDILAQLPPSVQTFYFENKDGVADFLLNKLLQNNDIVLIKGARYSSKLYQVADELLKYGK